MAHEIEREEIDRVGGSQLRALLQGGEESGNDLRVQILLGVGIEASHKRFLAGRLLARSKEPVRKVRLAASWGEIVFFLSSWMRGELVQNHDGYYAGAGRGAVWMMEVGGRGLSLSVSRKPKSMLDVPYQTQFLS